jgi:hypothetical protein
MSEQNQLLQIQGIVSNPTEEGTDELIRLFRDDTTPTSVKIVAADAILHVAFGPPSPEANEELAVWLEAAGVDIDKMRKEITRAVAALCSRN